MSDDFALLKGMGTLLVCLPKASDDWLCYSYPLGMPTMWICFYTKQQYSTLLNPTVLFIYFLKLLIIKFTYIYQEVLLETMS